TGGSGIATVAYELAPHGGSFNSQPSFWDTTLDSDGLYDLRVLATDVVGNTTTSATLTTRVDNTPPALTFSSPTSGTIVTPTPRPRAQPPSPRTRAVRRAAASARARSSSATTRATTARPPSGTRAAPSRRRGRTASPGRSRRPTAFAPLRRSRPTTPAILRL